MIWYLDSAHQNSWKPFSFGNSCAYTDQKLISNQLLQQGHNDGSSNKKPINLCLMIFHPTKSKNDLVFEFSTSKQLENTLFQ